MNKTKKERIHIIISAILLLSIGLSGGYALGFYRAAVGQFPEIQFVPDTNEGVTTVKFSGIKNGELKGQVAGRPGRIVYGADKILEVEAGHSFSIPINTAELQSLNSPVQNLPAGALFMASKKGKYYYSVLDPQGYRISEKNRIYFSTKKEAEDIGYKAR